MAFLPTSTKTTTDSKKVPAHPDSKLAGRHSVSNKDTYKAIYKGHKNPPSFETWMTVVDASNKAIAQAVIDNTGGFWLPHRLGLLIVGKRKSGGRPFFDRKHFCETGEKIPQLNLHTFGYTYRIQWVKLKKARLPLKHLFTFQAVRSVSRQITDRLEAGHDYLEQTYKFSSLAP